MAMTILVAGCLYHPDQTIFCFPASICRGERERETERDRDRDRDRERERETEREREYVCV